MNQQKKEKVFPKGMYLEEPREGAPDFVKGSLVIKIAELIPFLEMYQNHAGYVNLDLKESIGGKLYFELNTWEPKKDVPKENLNNGLPKTIQPEEVAQFRNPNGQGDDSALYPTEDINPDAIPF